MLNKIDWRKVQSCLEPSAGKGDLVEGIKNNLSILKIIIEVINMTLTQSN